MFVGIPEALQNTLDRKEASWMGWAVALVTLISVIIYMAIWMGFTVWLWS